MKLTVSMLELLALLADGQRNDIADERTALALERRGLAERVNNMYGHWQITPAGLSYLRKEGRA